MEEAPKNHEGGEQSNDVYEVWREALENTDSVDSESIGDVQPENVNDQALFEKTEAIQDVHDKDLATAVLGMSYGDDDSKYKIFVPITLEYTKNKDDYDGLANFIQHKAEKRHIPGGIEKIADVIQFGKSVEREMEEQDDDLPYFDNDLWSRCTTDSDDRRPDIDKYIIKATAKTIEKDSGDVSDDRRIEAQAKIGILAKFYRGVGFESQIRAQIDELSGRYNSIMRSVDNHAEINMLDEPYFTPRDVQQIILIQKVSNEIERRRGDYKYYMQGLERGRRILESKGKILD